MPSRSYLVKPWHTKAQTGEWCPSNLEHDEDFQLGNMETPPQSSRCEPERSIPTKHRDRRRIALQGPLESDSQPPEVWGLLERVEFALDFSPYRRVFAKSVGAVVRLWGGLTVKDKVVPRPQEKLD